MPRRRNPNPAYCRHKASGQAVVTLSGKDIYLGPFGSKASQAEYDRVLAEWLGNGRQIEKLTGDYSIAEVAAQFWQHIQTYYVKPDGTPTSERKSFQMAMAPLIRLYGRTPAEKFGPLALETVRNAMIEQGWCRKHVNDQIARVKMLFGWAVSKQLVNPMVHHGLTTVKALKKGRSKARESPPVKPIPAATVDLTMPKMSPTIQAMVQLQLLTGCRPGELCQMRTGDLDRSGEVWEYRPGSHKTEHHGIERLIHIGQRAQKWLTPFLKLDPSAHCFSPREAEAKRRAAQHEARVTPIHQGNSPGTNAKKRPKLRPGSCYTVASYRRAIARACDAAFPPAEPLARLDGESAKAWAARLTPEQRKELAKWQGDHRWHPHRLRHTAATVIRKEFGIESAQHVLGHSTPNMTLVYAEKNQEVARQVAAKIG